MKRISLALALVAMCLTAKDSAEAGHVAGCGCGVCRQQAVVQQLYANYVQAPPFYYQVGEQFREDAVAARVAQLTANALLEPLAQRTADLVAQKIGTTPKTEGMPKVETPPAPVNPPPAAVVPTSAELTAQVQTIFNRACISCHSGTTLNKQPFLNDIAKQPLGNPWKLWGLVHTGKMPKRSTGMSDEDFAKALLTDAEVDVIRDWVLQLDP